MSLKLTEIASILLTDKRVCKLTAFHAACEFGYPEIVSQLINVWLQKIFLFSSSIRKSITETIYGNRISKHVQTIMFL
jgi:hypothetical protein